MCARQNRVPTPAASNSCTKACHAYAPVLAPTPAPTLCTYRCSWWQCGRCCDEYLYVCKLFYLRIVGHASWRNVDCYVTVVMSVLFIVCCAACAMCWPVQDEMMTLTQAEHPVLGRPFFQLHPCNTVGCLLHNNIINNVIITRVRAGWPVRAASHVHLVVAELCCGTPCQLPAQRWELA